MLAATATASARMASSIAGSAMSGLASAMARICFGPHLDEDPLGLGGQQVAVVDPAPGLDLAALAVQTTGLDTRAVRSGVGLR